MADHIVVEPDDLRRSAAQNDLIAARLRKWGTIPQTWLDEFPDAHGSIADSMHRALIDYYHDRHEQAERLAIQHEQTRDQLLRAADELEQQDQHGGREISHSGGSGSGYPQAGGHALGAPHQDIPAPAVAGTPSPISYDPSPQPAPAAALRTSPLPSASNTQIPGVNPSGNPLNAGDPTTAGLSVGSIPPSQSSSPAPASTGSTMRSASGPAVTSATQPPRAAMPGPARPENGIASPVAPSQRIFTASPTTTGPTPGPLRTGPLAASAFAAKEDQTRPTLVVGDTVNDDLRLARVLLAAVLAAVGESVPGLNWATAVAATRKGPVLLLTSTEGRSWLPAGLFLPSEVIIPWRWESALRAAGRDDTEALIGLDDPARILTELVSIAGQRSTIEISALASSASVTDSLRSTLGNHIPIADRVRAAAADTDFSKPGAGLVDRLSLAGTTASQYRAETVTDTEIRATCHELLDTSLIRVHSASSEAEFMCDSFLDRRAQELRRLLAGGEPDRQLLRDMLYAHEQIERSI